MTELLLNPIVYAHLRAPELAAIRAREGGLFARACRRLAAGVTGPRGRWVALLASAGVGGLGRPPDPPHPDRRSEFGVAHPGHGLRVQPRASRRAGQVRRQRAVRRDRRGRRAAGALPPRPPARHGGLPAPSRAPAGRRRQHLARRHHERHAGALQRARAEVGRDPVHRARGGGDVLHLLGVHPPQHERPILHARLPDRTDDVLLHATTPCARCAASWPPPRTSSPSIPSRTPTSAWRAGSIGIMAAVYDEILRSEALDDHRLVRRHPAGDVRHLSLVRRLPAPRPPARPRERRGERLHGGARHRSRPGHAPGDRGRRRLRHRLRHLHPEPRAGAHGGRHAAGRRRARGDLAAPGGRSPSRRSR